MSCAVRFDRVTKTFAHHSGQLLLRDRVMEMFRRSPRPRFTALKDISFELPKGDSIALIGGNGAGKSTILNLASGLAKPDSGSIVVNGETGSLLELGSGFHPDLTGAENVMINAALMGLTRREANARFEKIVEFSGVREFIDEPLRTFSSGMMVRLAFSVIVHMDPDVLIVDEVLGVGDQNFYARCVEKIHGFRDAGKTLLLASHSADLVRMFCDHALWLEHGQVMMIGDAREVLAAYKESAAAAPSNVVVS
jgi:lipopolysaccharide transport system ATP-binding protein